MFKRNREVLMDVIVLFRGGIITKLLNEFDFAYEINGKVNYVYFMEEKGNQTIFPDGSIVVYALSKRPIIPNIITFISIELQVNIFCNPMVDFHYRENEWKKNNEMFPYKKQDLPRRRLQDLAIRLLGIYQPGEIIMTISPRNTTRHFYLIIP